MIKNRVYAISAVTLGVLTIAATITRLFFGVDFADEAFYSVVPYRFALGAKPFVDELLFQQTAALFTYPFVKLYYAFVGSTTGLIFFMRFLWLLFVVGVALIVWLSTKKILGRATAAIAALPCIAFIYFNIPALSYNNLGLGFLTAGSFLGFWAVSEDRQKWLPLTGLLHGLAVVAYPTLGIAVLSYVILMLLLIKKPSSCVRYASGGLIVAAIILILFGLIGFKNVLTSYQGTSSAGIFGGGFNKIITILKAAWTDYQGKLYLALGLAVAYRLRKIAPIACGVLLAAAPFVALSFVGFPGFMNSAGFIAYYSLLVPYLYLFVWRQKGANYLFWLVWTPGFIAGLTVAYTSSNGWLAVAVGFFQGALVTSIFLWMAMGELFRAKKQFIKPVQATVLIIPVILLVFFQYGLPYRDNKISALKTKVTSGAYAGLYTTQAKRDYLISVEKDLGLAKRNAKTILVFDNFPGGYLLSDLTPDTDWAWISPMKMFPGVDRGSTITYFEDNDNYPDLILRMESVFYRTDFQEKLSYPKDDPLSNLAQSAAYEPVVKRHDYVIFRRKR